MKRGLIFIALASFFAACSNHTDSVSETEYVRAHAEEQLGIKIADNQTWNMTTQGTVEFTNVPKAYAGAAKAIFSEDPYLDTLGTTSVIAYQEGVTSISFEAPAHYTKLYAACIAANGKMLVRPFKVGATTVDMAADAFQMVSKAAASRAARTTRAGAVEFQPTINATLFADNGWGNDRFALIERGDYDVQFTDFNTYAESYRTFIPEGKNSTRVLKSYDEVYNFHWAIVDEEGGEVTIIPVHKESAQYEYIGYFYSLPGEEINFKDVPKYVFADGIKQNIKDQGDDYLANAYRLKYYDKDGNESYTFPKGTKIYFFLHCFPSMKAYSWCNHSWDNELPIDYYSFPDLNRDMLLHLNQVHNVNFNAYGGNDNWEESPRVVYFNRNGVNYVGMEDGTDMDYNDIVFMIRGDLEDFPDTDIIQPTQNQVYTYAFEDTKMGDYDMNDVVLRVWRDNKKSAELTVQLVATGAYNNLKVYYDDHGVKYTAPVALFDDKEVHEALGIEEKTFGNTQTQNVTTFPTTNVAYDYKTFRYYKADFYIVDVTTGDEIHLPAAQGIIGSAPYAVCIPSAWQWPVEHMSIKSAYKEFAGYAANPDVNKGWYAGEKSNVFELK